MSLPLPVGPVVGDSTHESRFGKILRKAKGQPEPSYYEDIKEAALPSTAVPVSGTSSLTDEETKQPRSDTYAEGGQTKFYEPIPEYEGRHRWDPHAEWSEAEEKKLVRKVSL